MEDTPENYYEPCLRNYRSVNNAAARKEWFESTEPNEGLPKHTSIIHVARAEAIMSTFINRLRIDVLKNSKLGWVAGTPLPAKNSKRQPLGEAGN